MLCPYSVHSQHNHPAFFEKKKDKSKLCTYTINPGNLIPEVAVILYDYTMYAFLVFLLLFTFHFVF